MDEPTHSSEALKQAVDGFWETYPPLWRLVQAHIRQLSVEQYDLPLEQFHLLRHIRCGRDSVSALAEAKNISRPAISRSVDLLVTRGLVVRTVDPQDRRHIKLALTDDGNTLLDSVFGDTRSWMAGLFARLSPAEVRAVTRSMESLGKLI
jgi:DNA-binding MarR family transcriptional regulator